MRPYTVEYLEDGTFSNIKKEIVIASTKEDAYYKFIHKNPTVYSAWVSAVTYNNGNYKMFNTFSGMPY